MRSLRSFWRTFVESVKLRSRTTSVAILDPEEPLARFITSRKWYKPSTGRIIPDAFEPPEDLRLSLFRIKGMAQEQIWDLGRRELALFFAQSGKRLHGAALIKVSDVVAVGLQVDADNDPPGHVSIIGWPAEESARTLLAQQLAAVAKLQLLIRK